MKKTLTFIGIVLAASTLTGCKDERQLQEENFKARYEESKSKKPATAEEIKKQIEDSKKNHPPSYKSWVPPDLSGTVKKIEKSSAP